MRPHLNLRARGAMLALGALCLAISLSVLPGTAQSSDTNAAHAAVAADIAPGKSRLNVLAGRRAAVNGHLRSGNAGQVYYLERTPAPPRATGPRGMMDRWPGTAARDGRQTAGRSVPSGSARAT